MKEYLAFLVFQLYIQGFWKVVLVYSVLYNGCRIGSLLGTKLTKFSKKGTQGF